MFFFYLKKTFCPWWWHNCDDCVARTPCPVGVRNMASLAGELQSISLETTSIESTLSKDSWSGLSKAREFNE